MKKLAYIIKTYNRYNKWDREHAAHIFTINDMPYAIMSVGMDWGLPQVPEYEERPEVYHVYETKKEAMEFVQLMRQLN